MFPMILLEEYFELQEAEKVSKIWKVTQILSYVLAAGFGIWCGFTLALLRIDFDNRCFLFANTLWDSGGERGELRFADPDIYDDPLWSRDTICEYCQYSMVSSFIFATIWATFFLMCGNGGKSLTELPQPWRIALPAMIFNFIYFLIAFAAALQIQQGTEAFCKIKTHSLSEHTFAKCIVLKAYEETKANKILIQLEIVVRTSWITAISWFFAFLIPLLRIVFVGDFHLYKIGVYKIDQEHNENEQIIKITDYDEFHHVRFFDQNPDKEDHLHQS